MGEAICFENCSETYMTHLQLSAELLAALQSVIVFVAL